MIGALFDGFEVELDDRVADIGGAWQGKHPDGKLLAYGAIVLEFFFEKMRKIERPFVLDVGASTGSFCLLARFCPMATVLAFEPHKIAWQLLCENVRLNKLTERVTVLQGGLCDFDGEGILRVPSKGYDAGLTTLGSPRRFRAWSEERVDLCRLDSLDLEHIDLMKIDTEGAELSVLRGGERTIRRDLPGILLEYEPRNTSQFGYRPETLVGLLRSWGYSHFERVGREDLWATCQTG